MQINAMIIYIIFCCVIYHIANKRKKLMIISNIESRYLHVYDGVFFTLDSSPSAASNIDFIMRNMEAYI